MKNTNIVECIQMAEKANFPLTVQFAKRELERLENIDKNADNLLAQIQYMQNKAERLEREKKEMLDSFKRIDAAAELAVHAGDNGSYNFIQGVLMNTKDILGKITE